MLNFFADHLATILISAALIGVTAAILGSMIKNKRSGKSACGCAGGCSGCAMNGCCHDFGQ